MALATQGVTIEPKNPTCPARRMTLAALPQCNGIIVCISPYPMQGLSSSKLALGMEVCLVLFSFFDAAMKHVIARQWYPGAEVLGLTSKRPGRRTALENQRKAPAKVKAEAGGLRWNDLRWHHLICCRTEDDLLWGLAAAA